MRLLIIALAISMSVSSRAVGAERPNDVKGTIRAAENIQDESKKAETLSELRKQRISNPDDVDAVYAAMKSLEQRYKKGAQDQALKDQLHAMRKALATSTDPAVQAKVSSLLNGEAEALPANYFGPGRSAGEEENNKAGIRTARLFSLIQAAGDGKNERALPALRKIADKGGLAGEFANHAVGQIGKAEDLDRMVEKVKRDPKARIDLSPFGSKIIDRIMPEVDNPALTEDQRNRLIGHLGQAKGRASVAKFATLLHHKNHRVVAVASRIVSENAGKGDESMVLTMLKDLDRQVRFNGLLALRQLDWKNEYEALVISMLASDKDEGVRDAAAEVLGTKKVVGAQDALKAALNDSSTRVRSSAQVALDNISGKHQQEIDREVQEVLRRSGKK